MCLYVEATLHVDFVRVKLAPI